MPVCMVVFIIVLLIRWWLSRGIWGRSLRRSSRHHSPAAPPPPTTSTNQTPGSQPRPTHLLISKHVPHPIRRQHHKLVPPRLQRRIRDLRVARAAHRRRHQIPQRPRQQQPRRRHLLQPQPRLPDQPPRRQPLRLHARAGGLDALALGRAPRAVVDRERLAAPLAGAGGGALAEDDAGVAG